MFGRLLASVMLLVLTVGCGCRGEPASSAEQDRSLQAAKRWRSDSASAGPGEANDLDVVEAAAPGDKAAEPGEDGRETRNEEPVGAVKEDGAGDDGTQPKQDEGPSVIKSDTGDFDTWPSYDMPLVIQVEVPEFPERIQ